MRIIERGQLPADQLHVVRCPQCTSKIEFTRKEASRIISGEIVSRAVVGCPVCGEELSSDFPSPKRFSAPAPIEIKR